MENQITTKQGNDILPSKEAWEMMKEQANLLAKEASDFLPRAVNTPGKVLAIALIARDLNLPLMQALSNIHIVDGKPTMSSEQMLALIMERCHGAKIHFVKNDTSVCEIKASRQSQKEATFSYTIEEAKIANLINKDNWKKYPADMLKARAISRMARTMFPDILRGVSYVPDEIEAIDVTPAKEETTTKIMDAINKAAPKKEVETVEAEVVAEPEKEPEPQPQRDFLAERLTMPKEEIIKKISEIGSKIGMTPLQLSEEILAVFKKKPKDLDKESLVKYWGMVEQKMAGK